ncbi:MAG: winged helix-turn-helix domain-containing protein, partial [Paracoccaceae bacterium]
MGKARLRLTNRDARRLWIWTNGLAETPTGPCKLMQIVNRLGFVQIDTIRNVTRAHNHILWSRSQNYREGAIWDRLAARDVFEHFTHDASLIAADVLPYWGLQFARLEAAMSRHTWYQSGLAQDQVAAIVARIKAEGALSTHAFNSKAEAHEMWARPPHKKALDHLWYAGKLATSHREKFVKFYDLAERVFPPHEPRTDAEALRWLGAAAIDRLSFAAQGEVQRFWDVMSAQEAKEWTTKTKGLIPIDVTCADGSTYAAIAHPDIETRLRAAPEPTSRLRILNPFDPLIRDRNRLEKLFGFAYRNEIFVPKAKRIWGYYVYPLLEGARFVGRIELKGDRSKKLLTVTGFWQEPGVQWSAARRNKLEAELRRFGR